MLETILWAAHNATTLLFGVLVSAAVLDVRTTRASVLWLLGFSAVSGAAFALVDAWAGELVARQLYPLVVHAPLVVFLAWRFRRRVSLCVFAVLVAYLCCQVSNWVGLLALWASESMCVYYGVRVVVTVTVLVVLLRTLASMGGWILEKSGASLALFAMLPAVYYVFDYATNVYASLPNSGPKVVSEFTAFVLCLFYLVFLFSYFKQYEERSAAEKLNWMLETELAQASREVDAQRRSAREIRVLRHDMRHYLQGISLLVGQGDEQGAQERIAEVIGFIDRTVVRHWSANDVVNMALSTWSERAEAAGVRFAAKATVPRELPVPEADVFAIMSNALENAVRAASEAGEGNGVVEVSLRESGGRLLLSVGNTFGVAPELVDGVPVPTRRVDDAGTEHGLGVQSMRRAAERLGGNLLCSVEGSYFWLRAVL